MKKTLLISLLILCFINVKADEGMWMLPQIDESLLYKMHEKGCILSENDIYSENNTSLKDAVIVFGGGCSGVVVSNQGLIFTNHHCGYGAIQKISSIEHNYLKDGFTAKELSDEIPVPELTVKFLISISDVTERITSSLQNVNGYKSRIEKQDSVINVIKSELEKDNDYIVQIKSFYNDNEFYVYVYEEFKDIRLAYTPPSSIGKFGGDTDNWMWPRHTGDFSVFRIYSDSVGKAVEFSENNIPYTPKKVVPISLEGYKEGDFAMIIGNPGSTSRYITSYGLFNRMNTGNQARIDVRGEKQAVWKSFMKDNEAVNLAYANKYAGSSNYWKNSIGMNRAIRKLGIITKKQAEEQAFKNWVNQDENRKNKYENILSALEENYKSIYPTLHALNYLRESLLNGTEMPRIASKLSKLVLQNLPTDSLLKEAKEIYKNYYSDVDQATMVAMLKTYRKYIKPEYLPSVYNIIDKKFKGNYEDYAKYVYEKSAFSDYNKFSKNIKSAKSPKDPAIVFYNSINEKLDALNTKDYMALQDSIQQNLYKLELGIREYKSNNTAPRYPDANFTMRMTYGTISGYQPADAAYYRHYTTTQGVIEKEIPDDMEFSVPADLKDKINSRDFGKYTDSRTNDLFVNFLSTNDITGGNSGSPIFNYKGELLGLAFDGNWEAMSGDIVFEPALQRTINVDVRYILFIMDKIGGAKRLVKEVLY